MKYTYKIVGRNNDSPGETTYTGTCEGATPKEAMLHALVLEFEDSDAKPGPDIAQTLVKTGWIAEGMLADSLCHIGDSENEFTLYGEDNTYFVSVEAA